MSRDEGPPDESEGRAQVPADTTPNTTSHHQVTGVSDFSGTGRQCVSSQQVSWWSVHEHVAPILASVESWPMVGTPEWCALDDDDPVKQAALLDAGRHWALRVETCQQARCDASREVSDALDWSALARETNQRADFYASRPWLRREVA